MIKFESQDEAKMIGVYVSQLALLEAFGVMPSEIEVIVRKVR